LKYVSCLLCVIRILLSESKAALAQAFSPPPSRPPSVQLSAPQAEHNTEETEIATSLSFGRSDDVSVSTDAAQEGTSSDSSGGSWKIEYEEQVKIWRAQSLAAREKAEKERKRWEEIRTSEREDAARPDVAVPVVPKEGHEAGWETVSNTQKSDPTVVSGLHSPSLADSRDLVTGESHSQVRESAIVCRLS
jgi:hypothetical protein